ncbi:MAG: hypothetical protein RIC80_14680 [Cyclobacteriaceae bacterium]
MKKLTICFLFLLLYSGDLFSQNYKSPSPGKSLVYFVRFSGTGALINFKYFDGDKYLGKASGVNYFTYECDPGEHVFWVAAENRDYIKGNFREGATYILEVKPTMGAFKAAVNLIQVSPTDEKTLKRVDKILYRKPDSVLAGRDEDMSFFIQNGLERLSKIENEVKVINPDWTFN